MWPMLEIARRNLRRNWRHSLASMLSMTIGFMAVCLFEGFLADMKYQFEDGFRSRGMYGDVLIEKRGASEHFLEEPWRYSLNADEQARIDRFLESEGSSVRTRMRSLTLSGLLSNGRTNTVFLGVGFDVGEGMKMRGPVWAWDTLAGRPLEPAGGGDVVLLGRRLAEMLDCQAEPRRDLYLPTGGYVPEERPFQCYRSTLQLQATTARYQLNALDADVVGILDSGLRELDDKYVAMPLEQAQRLLDTDVVSAYSVALEDPTGAPGFLQRLRSFAATEHLELDAGPWQAHPVRGELFRRTLELLGIFRTFVVVVVVIIAAMSVVNTLSKSVAERTREIGTLRSIGYRRAHILSLFAFEGMLLALVACCLGLVLCLGVSGAMALSELTYLPGISTVPLPMRIRLVPGTYLLTTAGLVVIGMLAALWPARRAAVMRISDALGHV